MKFKVGSIIEHTNDSKYTLTNDSFFTDITLQEKRNKILEQLLKS